MTKFGFASFITATGLAATLALAPPVLGAQNNNEDGVPTSSRLSPEQYRQTILDIFGPAIKLNGRFEPGMREDGMLAIGARKVGVTDGGLEGYDQIARGIAVQVVNPANRKTFVSCQPKSVTEPDDACARTFISGVGRMLFRRPLKERELGDLVKVAGSAADRADDFYTGLSASLSTMLIAPEFLFRFKFTEPDPAQRGKERLTGYSKASVLSFFLWNTTPDAELMRAAEKGELHTPEGLTRQVDRMISSLRLESSIRAFFSDMLGFSSYETLAKDPTFYPRFTRSAKEDSMEETLRTIVDHVMVRQGDYRDLFTTRQTFLTRSLSALYGIPLVETTENGQPDRWMPYEYPAGDPRAGILSHASFVALHSPSGRSSPTDRGKAVRQVLLCQAVPAPPGNVDFTLVQNVDSETHKTARQRLTAHAENSVCAGCHKITDPIGLALENFDSAGQFRLTENGAPIDASGQLNGAQFKDAASLGSVLRNDPAVPACVARRAFAYGAGFLPPERDPRWAQIRQNFEQSGYKVVQLIRQIALSDMLFEVAATEVAQAKPYTEQKNK